MLVEGICFCLFNCFQPVPVLILLQGPQLPSCEGYLEEHIWPVEAWSRIVSLGVVELLGREGLLYGEGTGLIWRLAQVVLLNKRGNN